MILADSEQKMQENEVGDRCAYLNTLSENLSNRSSEICALALSSDSQAVWVNSFGPIAFCKSPACGFGHSHQFNANYEIQVLMTLETAGKKKQSCVALNVGVLGQAGQFRR